jgi:hypothetical protein
MYLLPTQVSIFNGRASGRAKISGQGLLSASHARHWSGAPRVIGSPLPRISAVSFLTPFGEDLVRRLRRLPIHRADQHLAVLQQ